MPHSARSGWFDSDDLELVTPPTDPSPSDGVPVRVSFLFEVLLCFLFEVLVCAGRRGTFFFVLADD